MGLMEKRHLEILSIGLIRTRTLFIGMFYTNSLSAFFESDFETVARI